MANRNAQADQPLKYSDQTAVQSDSLNGRYRQIGISAVAAAVRYQGVAKNPAYAPRQPDGRIIPATRPPSGKTPSIGLGLE
jgi:hypothetical protein